MMTNSYSNGCFYKLILSLLCCLGLSFSHSSIAGICDISGGSGIGGTGAPSHGSGIGGTGAVAHDGGIGGTGKPLKKNGSGIGGTGAVAHKEGIGGTGQPAQQTGVVVGTITGFGSICVNGIEIHYSSSTPLHRDGQPINPDNALAIGQVVAVGVSGFGKEVTAKEMHIIYAAMGPVSSVNIESGEIELLGQKIHLPFDTPSRAGINKIQVGDYIEVSGLRHPDGRIIASHISETVASSKVSVRGAISSISNNSFHIEGIKVNSPVPTGLAIGAKVEVSGRLGGANLVPDSIMLSQDRRLTAKIGGLVSIEGFLGHTKNGSAREVSGRMIEMPTSLHGVVNEIPDQQKVIITGRLAENDVIRVEHLLVEHDEQIGIGRSAQSLEENDHQREKKDHSDEEHGENRQAGSSEDQLEEKQFKHKEHDQHEKPEDKEQEATAEWLEQHDNEGNEELEAPETEEIEAPETEELEAPETEELEVPETEELETPETEELEVPETEELEVPEIEEIEVPEIEEIETRNRVIIPTGILLALKA